MYQAPTLFGPRRDYHPHFTDEEVRTQRRDLPTIPFQEVVRARCELIPVSGLAHSLFWTGAVAGWTHRKQTMGHLWGGGQNLRGPSLPHSSDSFLTDAGGGSRRLAREAPSADTQGWEEIALFISVRVQEFIPAWGSGEPGARSWRVSSNRTDGKALSPFSLHHHPPLPTPNPPHTPHQRTVGSILEGALNTGTGSGGKYCLRAQGWVPSSQGVFRGIAQLWSQAR